MDIAVRTHYTPRRSSEAVLEKIPGIGIVTRNRYGAEVLNADTVMFVDWDVPPANPRQFQPQPKGFLAALRQNVLGPTREQRETAERARKEWTAAQKALLEQAATLKARELNIDLRLYETCNGLRALVTSSQFDPSDALSQDLLTYFGADRLYARLCRIQNTFRARLTPKFWRIGMRERPLVKPPLHDSDQERMRRWLEGYRNASNAYATTRFIAAVGANPTDPVILEVIRLHDARTKAQQRLELA
jgi:hypothetical protein